MKIPASKYLLSLLLLALVACEVKIPETVIAPDKMEALLYDYHLAQTMSVGFSGEEYKRKLYAEYVFDKHGVTKELFDSSMVWYMRNPKHLHEIYKSLDETLKQDVALLSEEKENVARGGALDSTALVGDTVDLWYDVKTLLLSATPLKNRMVFNYKADSTYVTGDSIVMNMDVHFITPDKARIKQTAHAAMVVEYADSAYSSNGRMLNTSGHYVIAVPRRFETAIKGIRGYIYYTDNDTLAASRMLVGNISVLRIHPDENVADDEE